MANRRFNDEIDKMGIWTRATNRKGYPDYDESWNQITGFSHTKMERDLEKHNKDKETI